MAIGIRGIRRIACLGLIDPFRGIESTGQVPDEIINTVRRVVCSQQSLLNFAFLAVELLPVRAPSFPLMPVAFSPIRI